MQEPDTRKDWKETGAVCFLSNYAFRLGHARDKNGAICSFLTSRDYDKLPFKLKLWDDPPPPNFDMQANFLRVPPKPEVE